MKNVKYTERLWQNVINLEVTDSGVKKTKIQTLTKIDSNVLSMKFHKKDNE